MEAAEKMMEPLLQMAKAMGGAGELKKQLADAKKQAQEKSLAEIDRQYANPEKVADELWAGMDVDGDGNVTKDEFMAKFLPVNAAKGMKAAMEQMQGLSQMGAGCPMQ